MPQKIAILGASVAQKELYEKSRELGLYVIGFSWINASECSSMADKFYPISITETDKIVEVCKEEGVDGIVSNCSELAATCVSYIAQQLGLDGVSYDKICFIQDKYKMREFTNLVGGFSPVEYCLYQDGKSILLPCVIKPCRSSAKKGVSYADTESAFKSALEYARQYTDEAILVEKYVEGQEISVETLSVRGQHYIVQITDKDCIGAPHFIELGHHQPSQMPIDVQNKVKTIVLKLLKDLDYTTGAAHIELKINNDKIYFIEFNPRGGGDFISTRLTYLSTNYDYVKAIVLASLGQLLSPISVLPEAHSGVYMLTEQTGFLLDMFKNAQGKDWVVEEKIYTDKLSMSATNNDRNGYLIYRSDHKVLPFE